MNSDIQIKYAHGHYEAYVDDKFIASGDTWNEAYQEALEYIEEHQ